MNIVTILLWLACAVEAYLIGSVSFAYVIGKIAVRRDIRKYGSGNAGASNMTRNFGWKLGLVTFVGDIAKGAGAVLLGGLIGGAAGTAALGMSIAAVCAVVGHNWPVFFEFRGGKGVSTTLGVALVLMPWQALVILGISGIFIVVFRFVSVGSLVGNFLLAIAAFIFPNPLPIQVGIVVLLVLSVFSHRENIARLIKGNEAKLSFSGRARPRRRRRQEDEEAVKN